VLELADPVHARLLDLLDGSHSEQGVLRAARHAGIPAEDASALLRALTRAGYVVDAHALHIARATEPTRRRLATECAAIALRTGPEELNRTAHQVPTANLVMHRRLRAHVLVTGTSRLAVPIASILAASGIGHITVEQEGITRPFDAAPAGLLPTDTHRPRGIAAVDALRRVAPDVEINRPPRGRATFAVLVGFSAPASLTAYAYGSRRLAHLAVWIRDGTVVVGPLVRPGYSTCLNCVDLHRSDRDPDWRAIAAQLQTAPEIGEPISATTTLTAAAFAAHEVLTHIDGGTPSTLNATVEISEPGRSVRRQWNPHPACGCRRRSRRQPRPGNEGSSRPTNDAPGGPTDGGQDGPTTDDPGRSTREDPGGLTSEGPGGPMSDPPGTPDGDTWA
jgi:bacteriocin biosynthesis cyclodehydratase domain-containing protein